ncbi:MAG TPA: ATP-dependent DNA helicase RecG, partial [Armatimonadota bacterium]|nr:ATP-dependent DNA helicase RecG [Armatimonadota bacterium]
MNEPILESGSFIPRQQAARPAAPERAAHSELETPVQFVKGVGPRYAAALEKLGITTVEDLLFHFPLRYEDRRSFRPLGRVMHGETVVSSGRVVGATVERSPKRGMTLMKAVIQDHSGHAELVFFNQHWLKNTFDRIRGREVSIYGTASRSGGMLSFQHPEWEELTGDDNSIHLHRIVPVHPATEGLTPKLIRNIVWNAVDRYAHLVQDVLPREIVERHGLAPMEASLRQLHFPDSPEKLETARRRLVFDELFRMQTALALRKETLAEKLPGIPFEIREEHLEELRRSLPFSLTGAQERAIAEIRQDMGSGRPMNRLLQGDVGSGKTVVAAAAVVTAVRNGCQVAMMVPTEILAEQHYSVLRRLLEPLDIRVHRLVGSVRAKGKRQIKEELQNGFAHVVVGTHALLEEDVQFQKLGLVIVDEQHRFGVLQRLTLLDKGMTGQMPDMLVMTATPIPRTLALTVYGDLEVSVIDELPPGRKPIKTHWKRKAQRESVYRGIRALVQEGRQVYFVCPLVETSDKLQAKAATEVHEHLQQEVFPDLRVGLIHGQMPSHEKDDAMDRFREGEYDILVATVVIEVGVDVQNASCIVIEDAERFGLAQLHQLRGRVGRGEYQSFCVLLADPKNEEGIQRLEVMTRTTDGFVIAEEDLRLRGPGEFLGTRQSGILKLRIANIVGDSEILREARQSAFALVERDPRLEQPAHRALA